MTKTNDTQQAAAHTAEPWGDNEDGVILGNLDEYTGVAPIVAVVEGYDNDGNANDEAKANARRICAAVNACQGLSPEALKHGVIAELRHVLGELITAASDLDAAIDGATEQFDDERAKLTPTLRAAQAVLDNGTALDLHELLAGRGQIALVWSTEDVQEIRPDLTEEQAWEVLHQVERKHDATLGVSWLTLEFTAEDLFGDAPETDLLE